MAINEAQFSVTGYVATQPKKGVTKSGTKTLTFRIGWTPREVSRQTGEWADLPSSFASVLCFKKIAENGARCLRKGDAIVLKGTLRVREYDDRAGARRISVDVVPDFLGHDLAKGTSTFSKLPHNAQRTAEEYELSQSVGDGLPGDIADAHLLEGQPPEVFDPDEYGLAGGAEALLDDRDDMADVAPAGPDRDDRAEAHGDQPDEPDQPGEAGQLSELGELGELGDSQTTKSRGRSRKPEPVGAGL